MFKKSVIAIAAILLTMQGVSAVTMPLCEHGPAGMSSLTEAEQQSGMGHAHNGHAQDMGQDAGQTESDPDTHDKNSLACDDCEFCALSCASTLPSAELTGVAGTGHGTYSPSEMLLIGVTPRHLSKPPLLA